MALRGVCLTLIEVCARIDLCVVGGKVVEDLGSCVDTGGGGAELGAHAHAAVCRIHVELKV